MSFPYIIQGNNITVVIEGKPHTINQTHLAFEQIKDAIKVNNWNKVKKLIDAKDAVVKFSNGRVSIKDNQLYWDKQVMHNALSSRMIQMLKDGYDINPLARFFENLMQIPSKRAVDELYGFLEKNTLPITPDGYFLAYKKVRSNFFDVHSNTMDNSPGKVVEMPRNLVDDDKERTCSTGLHFCSQEYLKSFGGDRIVVVKINPKDVVSIPVDYNNSKGRCCRYLVLSELTVDAEKAFTKTVQDDANGVTKPSLTVERGKYWQ